MNNFKGEKTYLGNSFRDFSLSWWGKGGVYVYVYNFNENLKWNITAACSSVGDYILYFPGGLPCRWASQVHAMLYLSVKMCETH